MHQDGDEDDGGWDTWVISKVQTWNISQQWGRSSEIGEGAAQADAFTTPTPVAEEAATDRSCSG